MELGSGAMKVIKIAALIVGTLLIVVGLALVMVVPIFVEKQVAEEDFLGRYPNGSFNMVLRKFQSPQYEMLLEIWTFSIQNPETVIQKGDKPVILEKGPYTFVETQRKNVLEFEANDTRILYRNDRSYSYNVSLSCASCNLSDRVTVPNIIFQKLVDIALKGGFYKAAIETAIRTAGESIFVDVSVGEILFDGYKDPIVSAICDHALVRELCKTFGIPDRVGLFYQQNGTDDGLYEIDTGLKDIAKLGQVYSWNNMTALSDKHWYGPSARKINGTDGELFKPNLSAGKSLHLFVGQVCRSLSMDYSGYSNVQGVPTYQYEPSKSMYDVALQRSLGFCNPETPVFFNSSQVQEKGCSPSGLLDLSSCVPGNPRIYVSQPHFLNSPAELRTSLQGIREPSEAEDRTYVDIEPLSGVIINAKRRSQLNLGVLHGNLRAFTHMKNLVVPIIWLNETALFDADTREQILRAVFAVHNTFVIGLVLACVGAFLIVLFVGLVIKDKYFPKGQNDDDALYDPLVDDERGGNQGGGRLVPIDEEETAQHNA